MTRDRRWAVFAYFLALVVLGLAVFQDYGVSWDEPRQRLAALRRQHGIEENAFVATEAGQTFAVPALSR